MSPVGSQTRPRSGARPSCALVLEDGAAFFGLSFGAAADTTGIQLSAQMVRAELGMPTPYAGVPTVSQANDTRDTSFLDREKIIWEWPDVTARVIEEFR